MILDKKLGIAYRLEPMRHQIDAAAWLGFHSVVELFGVRAAQSVENDKPKGIIHDCTAPDHPLTHYSSR